MIPQETVQRVIDVAQIEEVVSDFVSLKRSGSNRIGLCPFHEERTPSFFVSPSKGIYKCFGCGKAGNSVGFIMEHEKATFPEAIRYLARKYNIVVEEKEETPEQVASRTEKESLLIVTEFAAKFFKEQLWNTDEGKSIGLSYFRNRQFNDNIIDEFGLGYSPSQNDVFTKYALKNGFSIEILEKSGLSITKSDQPYDRFKERIIFPIQNQSGKVIGFGARTLKTDKNIAKYLNSPESELYNKSQTLYGLYQAKHSIVANDMCFLVEGYTDVLSLYQAGIQNVVASSGTSLTIEQIKLIKRYSQNVTILYDGDSAGINATFRGIDMILEQGMNVKVLLFPDGQDPDSFSKNKTSSEIQNFIKQNTKDFIVFKLDILAHNESLNDPIKRVNVIKEFITSIAKIPDRLTRLTYIQIVANKLEIEEKVILDEVKKEINKNLYGNKSKEQYEVIQIETPVSTQKPVTTNLLDSTEQENEILRQLLLYGNEKIKIISLDHKKKEPEYVRVSDFILSDIENDGIKFTDYNCNSILDVCLINRSPNKDFNVKLLTHNSDLEIANKSVNLIATKYTFSPNWKRKDIQLALETEVLDLLVPKTILSYKIKRLRQLTEDILNEIKVTENHEEIVVLQKKYLNIKLFIDQINNTLGRYISY